MGHPWHVFRLFSSFQTHITILTSKCEKCPSSIQCWDSNLRPYEHKSPPITTRPGLPPPIYRFFTHCVIKSDVIKLDIGQKWIGQLQVEVLQLDGGVGAFENSSRKSSALNRNSSDQLEVGVTAEREAVDVYGSGVEVDDVLADQRGKNFTDGRLAIGEEDDALTGQKMHSELKIKMKIKLIRILCQCRTYVVHWLYTVWLWTDTLWAQFGVNVLLRLWFYQILKLTCLAFIGNAFGVLLTFSTTRIPSNTASLMLVPPSASRLRTCSMAASFISLVPLKVTPSTSKTDNKQLYFKRVSLKKIAWLWISCHCRPVKNRWSLLSQQNSNKSTTF